MLNFEKITPLNTDYLESLGFVWHTDQDESSYLSDTLLFISEQEAQTFYEAANTLYDMYIEAAQYVIDNNLFHAIGIPFNLVESIKESWQSDVHWHLYGRFDFAGGLDGAPVKLLEFNADTPTALFETAIVQWAMLKKNGLNEAQQFNGLYEALVDNFKRLVTLEEDVSSFEEHYDGWRFLFTSIRGNAEEENTVRLLQHIATEAGFETEFAYIDEIEFSAQEGIFYHDKNYELWFKLIPWEDIALEESDLAMLLTNIIKNQKAIIFNPPYTLLFQSKGLLKILWDLFPNHPLLLETSFEPLQGKKQVRKPVFGREGSSVSILDEKGNSIESMAGEYDSHKMVYQTYTQLPTDEEGNSYQAGVFYAYEACGLGFRKGGKILNNMSKFVGHRVQR
ncbi:MAG TPA: glutathionylspermidine synthase family protein [Sulfurovum sp.]|nr:MAG: glutathionylspermidine synthase [Sulfurovum sp. 35-42-20]OYY54901.1 MAG: glutathionylspermidine synthase [Sulfurovum sp. 28-43-6]OYZ24873.1 MAG: glutathionylspermidine synthase [Sulfurovum sp. 16-42-52]OYZ50344.1 MAG: glutathionylspermidine synthase [Sulfurovum sp. 24-42-9]OZA44571.1 MAG: glutathionylspermidine synthase [Sulfurovum sp. 17-42-90]OZA61481.1 MAG: glutathionylspermidine synthase [Sulfurovum sp. 39-42-12]HQR73781.1 glutathionylspermidine synthase family protein [Sulfurovum